MCSPVISWSSQRLCYPYFLWQLHLSSSSPATPHPLPVHNCYPPPQPLTGAAKLHLNCFSMYSFHCPQTYTCQQSVPAYIFLFVCGFSDLLVCFLICLVWGYLFSSLAIYSASTLLNMSIVNPRPIQNSSRIKLMFSKRLPFPFSFRITFFFLSNFSGFSPATSFHTKISQPIQKDPNPYENIPTSQKKTDSNH